MTRTKTTTIIAGWATLAAHIAFAQSPARPATAPDFTREAYVIEQTRTMQRFEDDGTGRRESYTRVRVQSEAGVGTWGQLLFPYNAANERLTIDSIRVKKTDGTTITAAAEAVQDLSSPVQREAPVYTDTREKHITVPGLRPGDTLEISLTAVIHTPLAQGHFWLDHDFYKTGIVLDESLVVEVPASRLLIVKTRDGLETATVRDDAGRRIYEWRTSRLANDEPKSKKTSAARPTEPERAAVRLTSFTTWQQLGDWYHGLEVPQRAPTPEIRAKALELAAGRKNTRDKLEAAYEFVAGNFRYVSLSFGVGRYQPHRAADILHNQYGDCKDKHTLLASLAGALGMHPATVLIHSSATLDPDFPSPAQFDHVITRVSLDSEPVWLDTTAEVAPFGLLAPQLRHKQAVVIDPDGKTTVVETPAKSPVPTSTTVDIDSTLSESGALSGKAHLTFSGDLELVLRGIFKHTPTSQWEKLLETWAEREGLDGEISNWHVSNPSAFREPFVIDYQFVTKNIVSWDNQAGTVTLPMTGWIGAPARTSDNDSEPIRLWSERDARYLFRMVVPATFTARPPVPVSLSRDYAHYQADYQLDGHSFKAERALTLRASELPASRRADFSAFARAIDRDLRQKLAVESSSGAAALASKLGAPELYDLGTEAVDAGEFATAIDLLKRALDQDPAHRNARTNLGRAYLGLNRLDLAIAMFEKQIELHPFDRYAYSNLGYAYRGQRKYAQAEGALRKQLGIDPLDRYAYEQLAGVYLDQQAYAKAVPELEKAIALDPKQASVRGRLGEALLHLGRHDDALASFTKAIELDPSPGTWNDVAYQLAVNRTDLDLAQRYAESAVAAVTAATRTIAIDHVTARDLSNAFSLGAYWDTLGWVYFAKGDMHHAEPWIRAAWLVTRSAEVGDHLAQVYERQGRRAEATRSYALALQADRPDADIKQRLASLVGGSEHIDAAIGQYRETFAHEFEAVVPTSRAYQGSADFLVLFDNGSRGPALERAVFYRGDEALRALVDALPKSSYEAIFPDRTPAKLLLRGALSCAALGSSCRVRLTPTAELETAAAR